MEQNEMLHIQKILRRILFISVAAYALFILCIFTILDTVLSQNVKIIVLIAAPMVVGGVGLLIIKAVKGRQK